MSKNLKKLLSESSPKPDPVSKDAFLRAHRMELQNHGTSTLGMISIQLRYISVWVWIITALTMAMSIICVSMQAVELQEIISSMMPFVSGLAVFQIYRSKKYGMFEMEQATINSGQRVMLARISGVGAVHLLCIGVVTILLGVGFQRDILKTGYMLIIPYLLTSVISMEVEYHTNRNASWMCIGVAAVVSAFTMIVLSDAETLSHIPEFVWMGTIIILCVSQVYEIRKLYTTEELVWN